MKKWSLIAPLLLTLTVVTARAGVDSEKHKPEHHVKHHKHENQGFGSEIEDGFDSFGRDLDNFFGW